MEIGLSWVNTRGSFVTLHNSRIPSQLEKTHEVPPSSPDEALSHCSVLREIPHSLLKFETVLDTPDNSKSSPTYRSHSRGTPNFPAQLILSPFSPPDLDMWVDSPTLSGKGSRPSRRTSEGLTLKLEKKTRGSCHIPKDTDFPIHSS